MARMRVTSARSAGRGMRRLVRRSQEHLSTRRVRVGGSLAAGLLAWSIVTIMLGLWIDRQIEASTYAQMASVSGLYVESLFEPHLQSIAAAAPIGTADAAAIRGLFDGSQLAAHTVSIKVWSLEGEILFSPNPLLVGRRFPVAGDLAKAVQGAVALDVSNLQSPENVFERPRWHSLLETYVPVRDTGTGRVIGAAELYQLPDQLQGQISTAELRSWLAIGGAALCSFLLFAWLVVRPTGRRRGKPAGGAQVGGLVALLERSLLWQHQSAVAAMRSVEEREEERRRISDDLFRGPGQNLGLALLRLDALQASQPDAEPPAGVGEYALASQAVSDALAEVRAIAADLRTPDLTSLKIPEIVARAIREYERDDALQLDVHVDGPLTGLPIALSIALFHTLRGALGWVTKFEGTRAVSVRVWGERGWLKLAVAGRGGNPIGPAARPGAVPQTGQETRAPVSADLARMRDRTELLGGSLRLARSTNGPVVDASWPMPVAAGDPRRHTA